MSVTSTSPAGVVSMPHGQRRPWPECAIVLIVPSVATLRTRPQLQEPPASSVRYIEPSGPKATPRTVIRVASVAGPPSPPLPPPATVAIVPSALMRRTRPLLESAMYGRPSGPIVTSWGESIVALVAGPPSPLKLPNT